jgi:menaquinone-9 beta-reductase
MPTENKIYDCAIVGGGLAGLCLSIQLAKKNHSVILFEKNIYPFHKVCGEYISKESWDFIESLGLNLSQMNLPQIDTIHLSAQDGYIISSPLTMGGFGISRFTLDFELAQIAKQAGVNVIENCKVNNVNLLNNVYEIDSSIEKYLAKLVCGSYGKISPPFIHRAKKVEGENYIGVKHHIKLNFPSNLIELHNFKDGYCGISKVDGDTYCLCYLTTSKNLKDNNNDINQMEKNILMQNPHLKKYFIEAEFLYDKPLAISNIGFKKKSVYQNDIIMLGDSAGAIAPLCGNGMSLAMRASKILASHVSKYLSNQVSKSELILLYEKEWNKNFSFRIKTGYILQKLFGKKISTIVALKILNSSPKLFAKIVSLTHGTKF